MELNIDNWKVKLIRSTYAIKDADKLPKSLCSFFWVFVSSIIMFPISIWGHIWNFTDLFFSKHNYKSGYLPNLVPASMVGAAMFGMGGGFGWKLCQNFTFLHLPTNPGTHNLHDFIIDFISLYYYSFILFLFLAIIFGSVFGLVAIPVSIYKKKKMKLLQEFLEKNPEAKDWEYVPEHYYMPEKERKERKPNIIIEYIKAVKNKLCPIIEYKKNEE